MELLLRRDLFKKNPKIFMGYSDITALLLAMNCRSGITTFHGPFIRDLPSLTEDAKQSLLSVLCDEKANFNYPPISKVLKPGITTGKLVGGNLALINSLLPTPYMPDVNGAILFREEVGTCPAMIDFSLQALRLSGAFGKISGMVVGHLSNCVDNKYPEDNRSIDEIILERTAGFDFPIVQVDYFGHDTKNFFAFPIGEEAKIDTEQKTLSVTSA